MIKIFLIGISIFLSIVSRAACDQTLNVGANVASAVKGAAAGSTICLNGGNYGSISLSGILKTSSVTLQSVSGQSATASVSLELSDKLNIKNMTITYMYIHNQAKNILVAGCVFKGQLLMNLGGNGGSNYGSANILIDKNSFDGISVDPNAYEGRIQVISELPSGVKITNNQIGAAGESDGIQLSANGVEVGPGNVFRGIRQGNYSRHVDSIQLYGATNTKIIGNYFFDNDVIIMAPDGSENEIVTNNVMIGGGSYRPAVQFGSAKSLTFTHNTVKGINVRIDKKSERPDPSTNAVVRNNIMIDADFWFGPSCLNCITDRNLFSISGNSSGTNSLIGNPVFIGGVSPVTWAGYQLATSSLGYKAGTDSLDLGTTYYGSGTSVPPASKVLRSTPTVIRVLK